MPSADLLFLSPLFAAFLIALAVFLIWLAFVPAQQTRAVESRLEGYVDFIDEEEMAAPFYRRALLPVFRRLLHILGTLLPTRNYNRIQRNLIYAGRPGSISVLDYLGLQMLLALGMGALLFFFIRGSYSAVQTMFITLIGAVLGYALPWYWLRRKVRNRQKQIRQALPDALDMLTISVEAGLAFESALLRVGEQWHNPLTDEFRRVVGETRMGSGLNEALERMIERTGVNELSTFVAVLIQSSQLGVSIAQVLNSQAAQMREVRRQRAEELARQASIKIVVVLVIFIFPAMFIVLLGPTLPEIQKTLESFAGG